MKKFFRMITNKWLLKGTTTLVLVALIIACYMGLNWGAEKLNLENLDFTTKKLYSLSNETRTRLDHLEEEITIQLINAEGYLSRYVSGEYVKDYARKYSSASKKVKVEEIDDISSRVDLLTKYSISSTDILIVIKSGENEEVLYEEDLYAVDYTTYEAVDKTEEAITNAITRLVIKDKPKVYVLTGGKTFYAPEQVLSAVLYKLNDEANEVDQLDLLSKGNIPEDCDCLVITTLKQDLTDFERDKILEYINRGGKIFMLSSQNIIETDTPNLDQIMAVYGISIEYGVVFEQDSSRMLADAPELIIADVNASFISNVGMGLKALLIDAGKINFAAAEKLEELGVVYETIATTSEKAFVRTKLDTNSSTRTDADAEEGTSTVGAYITKTISEDVKSELIVYSSEIMATNMTIALNQQYAIYPILERNNQDVVLNSIAHLTERKDTITIRKAYDMETYTVTDQEDVIIKTIIFTVPFIVIIIGIAVWVYRRRRV